MLLLVKPLIEHTVAYGCGARLRYSISIGDAVDIDWLVLLPVGGLLGIARSVGVGHVVGHNAQSRLIGIKPLRHQAERGANCPHALSPSATIHSGGTQVAPRASRAGA